MRRFEIKGAGVSCLERAADAANNRPMPTWIVLTAAATIVITGALTWVLWRLNQGAEGEAPTRRGGADGGAER